MNTLGDDLLYRGNRTADFVLVIYDGVLQEAFDVHKLVLITGSPWFARTLTGRYHVCYKWVVPDGSLPAARSILRFLYTRQVATVRDVPAAAALATQLQMGPLARVLRTQLLERADAPSSRPLGRKPRRRVATRSQDQMLTRSTKRLRVR